MDSRTTVRFAQAADRPAWDALVASSGSFLQGWRWGEFRQALGWQPVRMVAEDAGDVVGVMQALLRRFRPVGGLLYVPRGPVAATSRALHALLATLPSLARGQQAWLARVEPDLPDAPASAALCRALGLRPAPVTVQLPHTALVDLAPPAEEILAGFRPTSRRNVRLAAERGIVVREGTVADLPSFYRLERETAARQGIWGRPAAYYERFFAQYQGAGAALFLAELAGEPLAAAITLECGRTATYIYGASSRRHRETHPSYLLQWTAMQHARAAGCITYDLFGCGAPGDRDGRLAGLTEFKGGFGPVVGLTGAWDVPVSPLYPVWRQAERWRKRAVQARARHGAGRA